MTAGIEYPAAVLSQPVRQSAQQDASLTSGLSSPQLHRSLLGRIAAAADLCFAQQTPRSIGSRQPASFWCIAE